MTVMPVTVVYSPEDNEVTFIEPFDEPWFGQRTTREHTTDTRSRWPRLSMHAAVLGKPEHRAPVQEEITGSYLRSFDHAEVSEIGADGALGFDIEAALPSTSSFRTNRLVIAELTEDRPDFYRTTVHVVLNYGPKAGCSLLLTGEEPPEWFAEKFTGPAIYALGPIECTPDDGAVIAAALRGGVVSPAGLREVLNGAPMDWVAAFESGAR